MDIFVTVIINLVSVIVKTVKIRYLMQDHAFPSRTADVNVKTSSPV